MKLAYPLWDRVIEMGGEKIPVLSIENEGMHFQIVDTLRRQIMGDEGAFILSDEENIISWKKSALFFASPWDLENLDKKIVTKLLTSARMFSREEDLYQETCVFYGQLLGYTEKLLDRLDVPLRYADMPDLVELLKALHVELDWKERPIEEQMLEYINVWELLFGETCFIFSGFRSFLSAEGRAAMYKDIVLEKRCILMIEDVCCDKMEMEDLFIIDKDLCEIY